jgi:anti-sigma factor RsiW
MSTRTDDKSEPTASQLAELSRLADGTLDPSRRPSVEARIAASPELSALYERERRVVAALHQARATDRAPADLRARIEAARPTRRTERRRRLGYAGGLAGALAALALALALILPSGTPGAPSVSDAAALATLGATGPAPTPDPAHPKAQLGASVGQVYFPNWSASLGAHAVGARTDVLHGRRAVTVYYDWHGRRVAYTIVAAPALAQPSAHPTWLNGTELRTLKADGRTVVTWRESGDTCVLSGSGVSVAELQKLAAWSVRTEGR